MGVGRAYDQRKWDRTCMVNILCPALYTGLIEGWFAASNKLDSFQVSAAVIPDCTQTTV